MLAIASWPARQWLIDKGVRRPIATFLLTVLVGALIVGPLLVLAVQMAREAGVIVQGFRDLKEIGLSTPDWVSQLPFVGSYLAAWWTDNLSDPDAAKELLSRVESFGLIGWGRSFGRELVGRLIILVFTLLTLFFAYRDGPAIIDQIRTVADRLFGRSGEHLGKEAVVAVRATVNGLVLVGLAEGAVLALAYVMAGVSHPFYSGLRPACSRQFHSARLSYMWSPALRSSPSPVSVLGLYFSCSRRLSSSLLTILFAPR